MILDRLMALLRLSEELLTRVLATNQATSSEATTATTTPRAESTGPNRLRCTREKARLPTTRPMTPQHAATPNMLARATAVRSGWVWTQCTVTEASRAPRYRPTRNPPKERIWTMAPSRRPWMAARATTATTTRSTQLMAGDRQGSAIGDGRGREEPAPPTKRRRTASGVTIMTSSRGADVARSRMESIEPATGRRTGSTSEMTGGQHHGEPAVATASGPAIAPVRKAP